MAQFVATLGAAQLILNVSENTNAAGNYSTFTWSFYMNCSNGSSWNSSPTGYSANIAGYGYSGSYTFDFRSTNSVLIAAATTGAVNHAADGTLNASGSATTNNTGTSAIGGPGTVSGNFSGTSFPPQVPTNVRIGTRAATSIQLLFSGPSSGSSPSTYIVQIANNSGFSGYTQYSNSSGNITMSGLAAGTNYWVRVLSQNASGNSAWVTVSSSTLVGPPGAPTGLSASGVTPTAMTVSWAAPTNVGGPNGGLTGWQLDYSLDSSFATGVTTVTGATWGTTTNLTGLSPGNTYYVRVRAVTSGGAGANSSTLTQTTLPSTPPTVVGTAAINGRSLSIALTPPSGVTGVDSWDVNVTDTVTGVTTPYTSPSSPVVTSGLVPGRAYTYSGAAVIGSYTSPYSTAQSITMPAPSVSAGSYFDGATAASSDTSYVWTGTTDESASQAKGKGVLGWSASALSGGSVVLARTTGAAPDASAQPYGGTMTVLADLNATAPSFRLGMLGTDTTKMAAVQASTPYSGSIYVNPNRDCGLAAEISWYTAAGALISRVAGTGVLVHNTDDWVRLDTGLQTSPATAAYATVAVINTGLTGVGWHGGDQLAVDGAMIMLNGTLPYFDGASPDTAYAQYDWTGTANASVSTLTPLTPVGVDPLADPDIPAVPAPPVPPDIPNEGIIAVATWRRYWASIPADQISTFLPEVPTLTLNSGAVAERQVRIRVYENPNGLTPNSFDSSSWLAEQIVSYMPPNTQMLIDGVEERVWASINGGPTTAADHLLYGTGGVPASWPILNCGIGYLISFDTPLDSPSNNLTVDVSLTRRA